MVQTKIPLSQVAEEAWESYVPDTPYLSGGTLNYAKYKKIGKTVHYRIKYTLSGANISGPASFSLPVAAHADYAQSDYEPIGTVILRDTGVNGVTAHAMWATGQYIAIRIMKADSTYVTNVTNVSSAVPFTWGSGDQIYIQGTYEAA
ncbi:MAG: hypothetical protein ACD_5C00016G0009 [uncultured bacterium]|nr:MAG: hypothetical protein ACD_5C00016G0009 [uncultured bacterium]